MGAGKTTILNMLRSTSFWKAHGKETVIVGADAFKLSDPLYHILQGITPNAAALVHADSIKAAEELLIKAIHARRDIVFDGTLAWSEYAKQTIEMLRDTDYMYTRGPGASDTEERYWVRTERRATKVLPYRVEIVGVTAEADVSVMRGIVRRITSGRDISVRQQLNSHMLFSKNFINYAQMADAIYLFDTTLPGVAEEDKLDYVGQLIATKPGLLFKSPPDVKQRIGDTVNEESNEDINENDEDNKQVIVRFEEAFKRFLRKQYLNVDAKSADELYSDTVLENDDDRQRHTDEGL